MCYNARMAKNINTSHSVRRYLSGEWLYEHIMKNIDPKLCQESIEKTEKKLSKASARKQQKIRSKHAGSFAKCQQVFRSLVLWLEKNAKRIKRQKQEHNEKKKSTKKIDDIEFQMDISVDPFTE